MIESVSRRRERMLYDFYERQGPGKVWATYLVVGRTGGGKDGAGSSLEVSGRGRVEVMRADWMKRSVSRVKCR